MDPFVAEIRIFAGNFAPTGWALCDGQLMPISQNTALFSLLGTTYGGDGKITFALPNLQGAVPLQQGQGIALSLYDLGEASGTPTVQLLQSEMPNHGHSVQAFVGRGANAHTPGPTTTLASSSGNFAYSPTATSQAPLHLSALSPSGGDGAHNNMMPSLGLTFIIALQGVYPPRS